MFFSRRKNIQKHPVGLTMMETLVTVFLFIIVIGMAAIFVIYNYRLQTFNTEQTEAIAQARRAMRQLSQELREALRSETGAYPIVASEADDFSMIFYSDIDRDEVTERVRYWLDGTTLRRETIQPTDPPVEYRERDAIESVVATSISNNPSTPIFTFYNSDYPADLDTNPLAQPVDVTQVTLIHIFLEVNVNPQRAPKAFTIETDVQLRNLKENL
jgi:type II secretory pathway pseudopilin PulG